MFFFQCTYAFYYPLTTLIVASSCWTTASCPAAAANYSDVQPLLSLRSVSALPVASGSWVTALCPVVAASLGPVLRGAYKRTKKEFEEYEKYMFRIEYETGSQEVLPG